MAAPCAALAAVIAVAGCGSPAADDTVVVVLDDDDELVPAPGWDEYLQTARAAGGDSGFYVVEGDLVFRSEEGLRAHYDELREDHDKLAVFRQLSTGYEPVYRGTAALRIRYCVSDAFSPNKENVVAAVASATRSWQNVANVRFIYDPTADASCDQNNASVDFAVMFIPGFSFFAGCASSKLLWSPVAQLACLGPGTLAMIRQTAIEAAPPPNDNVTMTGLVRHELGHMLGFRHEHPWAPSQGGCPEGPDDPLNDITGRRLTPYDQTSVMHYNQCAGTGSDFNVSTQDGIGARRIYGMPASWYVGSLGVSAWL